MARVRFLDQVPIGFYDTGNNGGAGGTPGLPFGSIQYNSGGTLSGNSNLLWDNNTNTILLNGSIIATSFTGSLFGTSSWAVSASQARTASYVVTAQTASYVLSASYALSSSQSDTASYVNPLNQNVIITGSLNNGSSNITTGLYSHAEGLATQAIGDYSHAEGFGARSYGTSSHAEGLGARSFGTASHAEGFQARTNGDYSHAEGFQTITNGHYSHAEGALTITNGDYSHAEGNGTITSASYQHAQGIYNITSSISGAFILGNGTDNNNRSNLIFAAGNQVQITGSLNSSGSIFFPTLITSSTPVSNVVMYGTNGQLFITASSAIGGIVTPGLPSNSIQYNDGGTFSGSGNLLWDNNTSTLLLTGLLNNGVNNIASGLYSHAEGINNTVSGDYSHVEGVNNIASGLYSHAEGINNTASGDFSHAEGNGNISYGTGSHAEGASTISSGSYSHAEGASTIASGLYSHAEGTSNISYGIGSHAEGTSTIASGSNSHAEGTSTIASGSNSHAEGYGAISFGTASHAEGHNTITYGNYSHAEGFGTITNASYQHTQGTYNITSSITGSFILGNGTDDNNRSNLILAYGNQVQITGSLNTSGSIFFPTLVTSSTPVSNVIMYGTNGQLFITASTAVGSGGGGGISGDYVTTASFNAYTGSSTSQFAGTSSFATTASYVLNAVSASYALSASQAQTASYVVTAQTASYVLSASYALSSSQAQTASYVITAQTASYVNPLNQNVVITGSLTNGVLNSANNSYSHAEGVGTVANGNGSHTEGESTNTTANGSYSHTEGTFTTADGYASHAEGANTTAYGYASHAEGRITEASGGYSHAEGYGTITDAEYQHAQGLYNITSLEEGAFILGNGTDDNNRSNLILAYGNQVQITGSLNVTQGITGSLFGTSSWATDAINAATASYVNPLNQNVQITGSLSVTNTLSLDGNLMDSFLISSTSAGSNNLFTQATGSYTSAHGRYTVYKGANSRAGEFVTAWNGTTTSNYDNSTADIGLTTDVSFTSSIVTGQIQINANTLSSGWTVKMLVTYL